MSVIRTVLTIGVFAILGLFLLRIAFGILGAVLGIFATVLFLALKVALILGVVYLIIRAVSPSTAQRLRERFSGRSV